MSTPAEPSSSASPSSSLAKSPLARVAALAVALGGGIAVLALTLPVLSPAAESAPSSGPASATTIARASGSPATTGSAAAAAAAAAATASATSEASTDSAVRSVVAALTAEGDVDDSGRSRMPRPSASTRMYSGPVDAFSTMTVYATNGAPQAALAGYTKALEKQGFAFKDSKPRREAKDPDEAVGADEPVAIAKTVRVFTKGDLEALVTVSQGESGALLTVIEGPRRSKS